MNDTKTVHLVSSRPRKDMQVGIGPTDTATDIIKQAGLNVNDYYIIKPSDQTEFQPGDLVYPHVTEGGKLNVIPQSDVGGHPPPAPFKMVHTINA